MSKRFEEKREAFEILNKELSDLIPLEQRVQKKDKSPHVVDSHAHLPNDPSKSDATGAVPKEWLDEQAALHEKYKLVERVYKFYRNIIQNMSSSIICMDMAGHITFLNANAAKTLEYQVEELLGHPMTDIVAEPGRESKIIDRMLIGNKRFESKEVGLIAKSGAVLPIGFSTAPLIENHEQIGVIITFRDLTEMNLMRKQVERMDRLATLGELATGIAHEVRNPLGGIKTAAQVLEESFEDNDRRLELVSRIVREIDRVNHLLTDFFKFAKPVKPTRDHFDVESLIDGVYLLLAAQMNSKKIRFKEYFSSTLPKVYADPHQTEQVLMNIILNAVQAMPQGGDIIVRTYTTTVGESKSMIHHTDEFFDKNIPFVAIEISDTGVGIPQENIEKIFNPFYTTKPDGMGLGLSICNRLLTENNGNLHVESAVGKGTKFVIMLPTR